MLIKPFRETFMINIISADTFKQVPWKNGLGFTTELAINAGGTLDNFDWRLSIATVSKDGAFSNFKGYQRNLVLISGQGITLDHQNGQLDTLNKLLDIAQFDGGFKTLGKLHGAAITDFNIMTKHKLYCAQVKTYKKQQTVCYKPLVNTILFAFSLSTHLKVTHNNSVNSSAYTVPQGGLLRFEVDNSLTQEAATIRLTGESMIIIQLSKQLN